MTLLKLLEYKPYFLLFMALIGWPLVTAVLNVALRKHTPAEWEAWALARPMTALVVELMRALGVDPKKALVAFQRYSQRKIGVVPVGAAAPTYPLAQAAVALLQAAEVIVKDVKEHGILQPVLTIRVRDEKGVESAMLMKVSMAGATEPPAAPSPELPQPPASSATPAEPPSPAPAPAAEPPQLPPAPAAPPAVPPSE